MVVGGGNKRGWRETKHKICLRYGNILNFSCQDHEKSVGSPLPNHSRGHSSVEKSTKYPTDQRLPPPDGDPIKAAHGLSMRSVVVFPTGSGWKMVFFLMRIHGEVMVFP